MSENEERTAIMNNITENIHDFTSSSDSDDEMPSTVFITQKSLFGRTEPVHVVLGGGKGNIVI